VGGAVSPGHPSAAEETPAIGLARQVIEAHGTFLDRVLDARSQTVATGLNRQAYGQFHAARMKTRWGSRCQRTHALVDGGSILASAEQYDLSGELDGRAVQICGVGSVWAEPSPPGDHARVLVDTLIDRASREGASMALLFSQNFIADEERNDFDHIPLTDLTLRVNESSRRGAPMTMVRAGEERDLAAIAAMGRVRAGNVRFHLDRDVDFIQYAITTKRLLAGLGAANARQLHFFIAEEGITAAAYVVVSVVGDSWRLEECGDRDASGARVGALLQALIAREPVERRPTIRAWLPPRFLPPQVVIAAETPAAARIGVLMLGSGATRPALGIADTLFWHNDLF
jgi:hypothetical protein